MDRNNSSRYHSGSIIGVRQRHQQQADDISTQEILRTPQNLIPVP